MQRVALGLLALAALALAVAAVQGALDGVPDRDAPEVGLSIGSASPVTTAETLSAVLARADEALYGAKRADRNRALRA